MTAPIPQLYICESAATCSGPEGCDHKKPHGHVLSDWFLGVTYCNECLDTCLFVAKPVSCIPFKISPTRMKRINKRAR